jgi:hypothetical protein
MNTPFGKFCLLTAVALGSCLAVVSGDAQTVKQSNKALGIGASEVQPKADTNAEREKIWNSPGMLRARAWLQDYCSKSAKVTPEMAKKYQQELENMTPAQMELWLLKFNEQEEQRQQQQAFWQQGHALQIQQARAVNAQVQQNYANINKEQTEAAELAEGQIQEQRENAQINAQNRMSEMGGYPYGPNFGPYGGYGYGYGGIHYHYHVYGNP